MKMEKISFEDVFKFVLDKALEEHRFSSTSDVAIQFGISKHSSRELLNSLVNEGKLTIVYENPQIKVYAPKEVIEEIVRTRKNQNG